MRLRGIQAGFYAAMVLFFMAGAGFARAELTIHPFPSVGQDQERAGSETFDVDAYYEHFRNRRAKSQQEAESQPETQAGPQEEAVKSEYSQAMAAEQMAAEQKEIDRVKLAAQRELDRQAAEIEKLQREKGLLEQKISMMETQGSGAVEDIGPYVRPEDMKNYTGLEPQSGDEQGASFIAGEYEGSMNIESYYEGHTRKQPGELYMRDSSTPEYPAQTTYAWSSWSAPKGKSVRKILQSWSQQAGVEFLWGTQNEFAVLQDIETQGTYEDAVAALLGQYMENNMRPVADLHVDPQNGQRVLVVQAADKY